MTPPVAPARTGGRLGRRLISSVVAGGVIGLGAFGGWYGTRPPRPSAAWPPDDRRPLVVIDAGHGGEDGGTQGFGVLEKNVAWATALRLSRELRCRGVRTALTREADTTLPLGDRIQLANDRGATAFVSVHFNFTTQSADVRGLEVFYSAPKDIDAQRRLAAQLGAAIDAPEIEARSTSLAEAVRVSACRAAATPDRGVRNRPDLAVTRRTACAAVLVECAYLSNPTDAGRAKASAWQAKLAGGLADGVVAWLEGSAAH